MTILDLLATIFGTLMSLGHFPQAYKIWRKKSAQTTSLLTYTIFTIGSAIWLTYGFAHHDKVIIITWSPSILGCLLVLGLALYYKGK